jgi:carbon storage regulator
VTVLVLTRKVDESIIIGNQIRVSILEIRGNHVKLGVDAPKDISVNRAEIYENIRQENIKAAAQVPSDISLFEKRFKMGKKGSSYL